MRILVVEDDTTIAEYIAKGFRELGNAVDVAHTGPDGLEFATSGVHDAVILDLMLPGMDGLEVLSSMRGRGVTTPVIILSAKNSVDDKVRGLQSGGDDYLTKPFSFMELSARVQALVRRNTQAAPVQTQLQSGDITFDLFTRQVKRGTTPIELHAKELTLLEYMMHNAGRVLTKTMILEQVWDYGFDPQTNVVEVLVHRLRTKLDKPFGTKTIRTIRGVGYVFNTAVD